MAALIVPAAIKALKQFFARETPIATLKIEENQFPSRTASDLDLHELQIGNKKKKSVMPQGRFQPGFAGRK